MSRSFWRRFWIATFVGILPRIANNRTRSPVAIDSLVIETRCSHVAWIGLEVRNFSSSSFSTQTSELGFDRALFTIWKWCLRKRVTAAVGLGMMQDRAIARFDREVGSQSIHSGRSAGVNRNILLELIIVLVRMRTVIIVLKLSLHLLLQVVLCIVNLLLQTGTWVVFDLSRFWGFRRALRNNYLLGTFQNFLQARRSSRASLKLQLLLMLELDLK